VVFVFAVWVNYLEPHISARQLSFEMRFSPYLPFIASLNIMVASASEKVYNLRLIGYDHVSPSGTTSCVLISAAETMKH
jgi:hypothetical protein